MLPASAKPNTVFDRMAHATIPSKTKSPVPECRKGLFFQTTYGEDPARKGYFAGHSHVAAHWNLRERASDSRCHRYAGRRTVLGSGALGNMDVDIQLLEIFVLDLEFFATAS